MNNSAGNFGQHGVLGGGQRILPPPGRASWANQVFFSIIQRKVLSLRDFSGTDLITQRLANFKPDNQYAQTFK